MNHSQRSSSSSGSSRLGSAEEGKPVLNLIVHGSAVSCAARLPRPRRKPSQPPNSPARPRTLPMDRLVQLRSELNSRLEEGCDLSVRSPSPASSHPDLALDLSSVTDSCRETDRSTTASSCDESEWSEGWTPLRPLLPVTHASASFSRRYPKSETVWSDKFVKSQKMPCERVRQLTFSSSSQPTSSDTTGTRSRSDWSCDKCTQRTTSSRPSHSDLIDVYVETVNNTQLAKFFRPCSDCNQISCQCLLSSSRIDLCTTCGCKMCMCDTKVRCSECRMENCECSPKCSTCEMKTCACTKNQLSQLRLCSGCDRGKCECTSEEDRNSIVSKYLLERRFSGASALTSQRQLSEQTGDSGNSTLQLEDSGREGGAVAPSSILSRHHVSLSVMQLATAAQCARILADSLESVLELAKEELTDAEPSKTVVTSAFRPESLLSAIKELNNADPRYKGPEDDKEIS